MPLRALSHGSLHDFKKKQNSVSGVACQEQDPLGSCRFCEHSALSSLAVTGRIFPICSGRCFILSCIQDLPFVVNIPWTLILMSCESGAFIKDSGGCYCLLPHASALSPLHLPNCRGTCNHLCLLISVYLHMDPVPTCHHSHQSLLSVGILVETWGEGTRGSLIGKPITFFLSHHSLEFSFSSPITLPRERAVIVTVISMLLYVL